MIKMYERDQPEFCDDCPLSVECSLQGRCAAFDVLYPVGETGVRERLQTVITDMYLLEKCLDDYCPQIGMTYTFRQYFYHILGHYPDWITPLEHTAHFELWKEEVLGFLNSKQSMIYKGEEKDEV